MMLKSKIISYVLLIVMRTTMKVVPKNKINYKYKH